MKKNIALILFVFLLTIGLSGIISAQTKPSCEDKKDTKGCCSDTKTKSNCSSEQKSKDGCSDSKTNETSTKMKNSSSWNSVCPVSGEEVSLSAKTVKFDGKEIAFCCDGCASKFEKDPSNYMKNLSPDGKTFIKTTKEVK